MQIIHSRNSITQTLNFWFIWTFLVSPQISVSNNTKINTNFFHLSEPKRCLWICSDKSSSTMVIYGLAVTFFKYFVKLSNLGKKKKKELNTNYPLLNNYWKHFSFTLFSDPLLLLWFGYSKSNFKLVLLLQVIKNSKLSYATVF